MTTRHQNSKSIAATVAGVMLLGGVSTAAHAQDEPCSPLTKSGTFVAEAKNVGFLAGIRWGTGTATMNDGRTLNFKFHGIKAVETGAAVNDIEGEIYNLKHPLDIIGTYYGSSQSIKLVKGPGEAVMNNDRCVVIKAKATGKGLQLSAPTPAGIKVQLAD